MIKDLKILMMLVKALETNNVISAVQLVPQGIIRYIYPLKKMKEH
jgi:hypothetical protein